jgi:hypothetical protein
MHPRFAFILISLCWAIKVKAGNPVRACNVDSLTYRLYSEGKFDSLEQVGNEAISFGIDFPYLRLRLGIAAVCGSYYTKAIRHLKRARVGLPNNSINDAYLWKAYQLMGWTDEANALGLRPGAERFRFEQVGMSATYLLSNNQSKNSGLDILNNGSYANTTRFNNGFVRTFQARAGLGQHLHVKLLGTVNSLESESEIRVNSANNTTPFIYDIPRTSTQVFGEATYQHNSTWAFSLGIHHLTQQYDYVDTRYDAAANRYDAVLHLRKLQSLLGSAQITYTQGNAKWMLGISSANLDSSQQQQADFGVEWYPLGNLNLYFIGRASALDVGGGWNPLGFAKIGVKILPKLWVEGFCLSGPLRNYQAGNGSVIFNIPNEASLFSGASLLLPLGSFVWGLNYSIMPLNGQSTALSADNLNLTSTPRPYLNQLFSLTLKWHVNP